MDNHAHLTPNYPGLQSLTHVGLDNKLADASQPWAQVMQHLAQLPALCSLALEVGPAEPAISYSTFSQLSLLTALDLRVHGGTPQCRVDLRGAAPGLRALSVQSNPASGSQEGAHRLVIKAPSVSYVQVHTWPGIPRMPDLMACDGLCQLVVGLRGGTLQLDHLKLPPQRLHITCFTGHLGRVFTDAAAYPGARYEVHLRLGETLPADRLLPDLAADNAVEQ